MANGLVSAKEISKIAKDIVARDYDFENIGLRVQESTYGISIGEEIAHRSNHWYDGEMLPETINGICAVSAKQAASINLGFGAYVGNVVFVIGSNSAEFGDDDGEIIMRQSCGQYPVVLDIIIVK